MSYSIYAKTSKRNAVVKIKNIILATVVASTSIATVSLPGLVFAKGGAKTPSPIANCDPIVEYSVIDGDFTGGYAIQASLQEQQCVSGKTIVKIAGINASTGRTEFSTPNDFDKSQVTFYGVRRSTTYEIKVTITSARDGSLVGSRSAFITTRSY